MNKIFTHSYKIEIFSDGKFCWRNHGWVEKGINDHIKNSKFNFYFFMFVAALIIVT